MTTLHHSLAYHTLPPTTDTALLVFGDHASRGVPVRYKGLGLPEDDLGRHIAWDIGTEVIIRALSARFGCAAHIAGFSRLLIDPNRDPNGDGLIPTISDGTVIPANQDISEMERAVRMAEFYAPYHGGLSKAVEQLSAAHKNPLVLSIHSFTPHPLTGTKREMDLALLVKDDTVTAERFMARAKTILPDFDLRINQPYSAYDLNHTIDVHAAHLRHLAIEIRQDHISDDASAEAMAVLLGDIIEPLISPLGD